MSKQAPIDFELPPFEPELARASTLPARVYTDPAIYERERERIFARTWQPVGRTEQLRAPGDYFTTELCGEPIVVLRDKAQGLRAFYNVCRHRAGPVAAGCGRRMSLTCAYHGWTYGLDGSLLTTPEFEGVACFDKASSGLVPIAVAEFGPFLFCNLAKDPEPLGDFLGRIPEETAAYAFHEMTMCERRDYEVACNWKVYIDNYLEGYHIPLVHPALYRELQYPEYRVETHRYHSRHYAPLRPDTAVPEGRASERPYAGAAADAQALYYWVFPGFMLNIYPDNLQSNIVIPLGPERTQVIFEWYMLPAGATGGAAGQAAERRSELARDPEAARATIARGIAFSDQIQKEDAAICEAVQKRLGSRAYDRGRFSVKRENGVHHFHGLWHELMSREG